MANFHAERDNGSAVTPHDGRAITPESAAAEAVKNFSNNALNEIRDLGAAAAAQMGKWENKAVSWLPQLLPGGNEGVTGTTNENAGIEHKRGPQVLPDGQNPFPFKQHDVPAVGVVLRENVLRPQVHTERGVKGVEHTSDGIATGNKHFNGKTTLDHVDYSKLL